jgi:diguanylate cyclase (GGDEF)-like protein
MRELESEAAVARRRDIIIERSRWICSVLLMSAVGAAIFGVAGADGRGSSWSAVHPKRAHVIVVHSRGSAETAQQASIRVHSYGPAAFHWQASPRPSSTTSPKGSSRQTKPVHSHASSGYSSNVTASPTTVADHHTASGSTPAQHIAQAPGHVTVGRNDSAHASVHASHSASSEHHAGTAGHARFSARSDNASPNDGAAVSAALGALTGASIQVETVPAGCPTDTSTTTGGSTVPGADPASPAPGDPGTTATGQTAPGQTAPGQTTTAQAPGCGAGQATGSQGTGTGTDTGTQDNNGQSNTVPRTGTTGQNGQGDSGQPGQGDGGSGQPGQGNTGQPGQSDGGQGQGAQGTTCPTGPTGAGVGGTQGTGQGGGGDATGAVTPIVGGSSDNGMSDQTPPDTGCGQDSGGNPGGPLTSPSPGTGDTGDRDGSSTQGSGPLTAVAPGQNGSSPTPTLPTVPITISPSITPVTVSPSPVTVNPSPSTTPTSPNPVSPVNPRPKTTLPVTPKLISNGFSLTAGPAGNSFNGTPGRLAAPTSGGTIGAGIGTGAGAGAGAAAGLGTLAPATSQIGVRGSGKKTSHKATHGHSSGSNSQSQPLINVPGAQALVQFVDRVPEWAWLALAGLAALAAVGFGAAFRSGRRVRRQASAIAAASAAALTDPLTGVVNRRGFSEAVDRELARARRYDRPFVLAYVDVRGLKAVNDTEGHLAGDELLKSVASLLHDSARADDVVGRLGGDELGLLLVEQSADGAEAVTQRIQSLLPERRAELGLASAWGLTIGTAAYPQDGESFNELLATADRRLYEQRGIEIRRA